ncbi:MULTISPECIES: hypothetical protein [Moorena]|uniref:Essential protein Yae1 N-terminal domain-containing protein n=1 Tax=Moorena producens 3L TaxID=489825 RepID=F4XTH7_9CYAN|nr:MULTISPECIES: hypothetical protein [Moorena]EGJ32113.1 hypothetical protein LYNGBM3L_29830 [Moorena producens 3L]NEP64647.1 hypothetical protein [Moorena sp. SIO3A5]NER85881.1 hypothetical protein [Moorena sp. SIO3A2]OLT68375.1 hypothetical protein BI334_28210 [Moorena producens 3L]
MPLISRVEERAMKRGFEKGFQQGFQQGLQQGLQECRKGLQETVVKILQNHFESVSPELVVAINAIEDISVLKQLIDHSLKSNSLEEFEQLLAQHHSLGALSVGELNSPRVAPLPTPYNSME